MKILLTGTTGQVGWELQRTLMTLGTVIVAGREAADPDLRLDLAQPDRIVAVVRAVQPDWIVNPAAYTAVDQAESEPDLAMAINGKAPGILAEEAQRLGAAIVHYSTDYVFDGTATTPYQETDTTSPLNVYGQTKLAGESAIRAVGVPHLILRTAWVYSWRGKNFLRTMVKLAQEREELRIVNDQIGAPTWSRTIAQATAQILAKTHPTELAEVSGTYHLTTLGQTTWYEFAQAIFALDPQRADYRLQCCLPIATADYPTPARRPAYSVLDHYKLQQTFGLVLPDWRSTLALVMAER